MAEKKTYTKEKKERIKTLLKQLADHADLEDRASRERQLRTWRRLKLLWDGYSRTWYSETAHDWRIWDEEQADNSDQDYYDKPINIFRAYLESIIAALSVTVPPIICYPDDADNTMDKATAKAGTKIGQKIFRENKVPLLWIHALWIFSTESMVGCYHRPVENKDFGTYEEKQFEEKDEKHQILTCPRCENILSDNIYTDEPPRVHKDDCDQCGEQEVKPNVQLTTEKIRSFKGSSIKNKSRVCMDAYGGLNVKVSNWARKQEEIPYLIYAYETHYANALYEYEDLHDDPEIEKMKEHKSPGAYDQYDQWARLSSQYMGEYPINVVTVKHHWFRPALYHVLKDDKDTDLLLKEFPDGVRLDMVNGIVADFEEECLDDRWTLTFNPLAHFLQNDPIALLLVSVQELVNDLISLTEQTIEHGIGQTFADPGVMNFHAYKQAETTPGAIFPIKQGSLGNKAIGDAFYQIKTATLSGEVLPFLQNIQTLGQMVSGALPSLWGGQIEGSKTASVYSMSRNQALQRQGNIWKMFLAWWECINGKTIPMYINECIKEDERDVVKNKDGSFINVFIRKSELEGKIGKIEIEANENLPLNWNQVRDNVMQLLQAPNQKIMEIISSPENIDYIREAIGLEDIYVPGQDDRDKQYEEIEQLLNSEPLTDSEPSVEVDPIYDNHMIEFEIVRNWVTSETGRFTKVENPAGYKNVLLHGLQHQDQIKQSMMANQPPQGPPNKQGNVPPPAPNPLDKEAPITGDRDVQTVQ